MARGMLWFFCAGSPVLSRPVALLAGSPKPGVGGSSPSSPANKINKFRDEKRLIRQAIRLRQALGKWPSPVRLPACFWPAPIGGSSLHVSSLVLGEELPWEKNPRNNKTREGPKINARPTRQAFASAADANRPSVVISFGRGIPRALAEAATSERTIASDSSIARTTVRSGASTTFFGHELFFEQRSPEGLGAHLIKLNPGPLDNRLSVRPLSGRSPFAVF